MQVFTIERLANAILFILLFTLAVQVPADTDTWWHLRSGETTLEDGSILREDQFSHTKAGEDWVNHSWGAQIILYGMYKLTGGDANPAGTGTIGLALYTAIIATLSMWFLYKMCAGNIYSRMFVLVIGATTAAVFWSARPQMFSFLFGTITLYLLYLYRYQKIDRLWFLPLLMIVWVNLHAGFAIGFIILLGFIGGEMIGTILKSEDHLSWKELQKIGLIFIVSIAALSINPYGPRMILYPFDTAGIQVLNLFIQEWRSPDFKMPQTWPFLFMLGTIIVLAGRVKTRVYWGDLALVAGTAILALWSARNISTFAIVATPVLARLVHSWLQENDWIIEPSQSATKQQVRLNYAILGLALFAAVARIGTTLAPAEIEDIHEEIFPVNAIAYLEETQPAGPILNDYNWGGYLIFVLPEYPVFVDGRTDLYGDSFLKTYIRSTLGAEEWQAAIADNNINLVLISNNSALATLLRTQPEQWRIGFEDDNAIIFERITPQ